MNQKWYVTTPGYQKEILETAKDSDLKQDRKILKDRSESNWPNQIELLYQLWQDIILNDVIQLNLNGNEHKRIVLGDWYNSSFILNYQKNKILIEKTHFS